MAKYKVISPLKHDGKKYAIGDLVELEKPIPGATEDKAFKEPKPVKDKEPENPPKDKEPE